MTELLLNRTWRPQLAVTGGAGLPPLDKAGNVLRPHTALRLSLRVPPLGAVWFVPLIGAEGWSTPSMTGAEPDPRD